MISGTMSGEFRVQKYRLKKKIAEAVLAVCILDFLLSLNADSAQKRHFRKDIFCSRRINERRKGSEKVRLRAFKQHVGQHFPI